MQQQQSETPKVNFVEHAMSWDSTFVVVRLQHLLGQWQNQGSNPGFVISLSLYSRYDIWLISWAPCEFLWRYVRVSFISGLTCWWTWFAIISRHCLMVRCGHAQLVTLMQTLRLYSGCTARMLEWCTRPLNSSSPPPHHSAQTHLVTQVTHTRLTTPHLQPSVPLGQRIGSNRWQSWFSTGVPVTRSPPRKRNGTVLRSKGQGHGVKYWQHQFWPRPVKNIGLESGTGAELSVN